MQQQKNWGVNFIFLRKKADFFGRFFCFLRPAFGHGRLGHPQSLEYFFIFFFHSQPGPTLVPGVFIFICVKVRFLVTKTSKKHKTGIINCIVDSVGEKQPLLRFPTCNFMVFMRMMMTGQNLTFVFGWSEWSNSIVSDWITVDCILML